MSQLRIYLVALEMVAEVALLAERVARKDRDLARQMKKASTSVPLNISEGAHARGGNKPARYQTAMAEARETIATIQTAVAARYIGRDGVDPTVDKLDRIVATMWRLIHPR